MCSTSWKHKTSLKQKFKKPIRQPLAFPSFNAVLRIRDVYLGCLSRDPNFSIPDPGSRVKRFWISGSASKNSSIFTLKLFLSFRKNNLRCSSRIPDPDFFPIPDPESWSRIQGSKKHRIMVPDPQHWLTEIPRIIYGTSGFPHLAFWIRPWLVVGLHLVDKSYTTKI